MNEPAIPPQQAVEDLTHTIDEALELLREFSRGEPLAPLEEQSPGSLLDQCLALCAEGNARTVEPIRTIHHLACTGGTMMSKCIAAMPNIQVISEVDPLSTIQDKASGPRFAPTDMISLARQSTRGASRELLMDMFMGDLELVHRHASRVGQRLVLRDHAHSHFCSGPSIPDRPSFRDIVMSRFPVLSVVTVRHPIDTFLALRDNKFVHFQPFTFDEYCKRFLAFLAAYRGLPLVKYEDFVQDPREVMRGMCERLELTFSEHFMDVFGVFKLTGDSGRKSDVIEQRPRRPLDAAMQEDIAASRHYRRVQDLLDYE